MRRRRSASRQINEQAIQDQSSTHSKLMNESNARLTPFEVFVKSKLEKRHNRSSSQVETHQEGLKRIYTFKMPFLTKDLHLSIKPEKEAQNPNSTVSGQEEEQQGAKSKEKLGLLVSKEIFKKTSCLPEEFHGKVLSSRRTSMANNQGFVGDSLSELEPKHQDMEIDHNSSTYKMRHNASRTTNFTVLTRNHLNDSCKNSKVFIKVGSYNMSLVGSNNDIFSSKVSPKEEQQATVDYAGTIILPQDSAYPSLILPEMATQQHFKLSEDPEVNGLPKCLSELEVQQKLEKIMQRDVSSRGSSRFKDTNTEFASAQEPSIDEAALQAKKEAEVNKIHKELVLKLQAQATSQKPKNFVNGERRTRRTARSTSNSMSVAGTRHSRTNSIGDSRLDKSITRLSALDRSFKQKITREKLPKLEVVPEWLKKREDFKDALKARQDELSRLIISTCDKLPYARTEEELKAVSMWLQNIKLFQHLPEFMIYSLASKVRHQVYHKEETICKQGEPEDYLFIIYDGIVRSYISGLESETYVTYDTIGQSPIDSGIERPMTLVAETETSILKLGRHDYRNILEQHITQEKTAYFFLLNEMEILKDLDEKKRKNICFRLKSKHFAKGEVIYEEGEDAEYLYIIRSGKVHLESKVTIEKENIWPTGKHEWEKTKHIRDMKFQHDINAKRYFGEVEIINHYNRLNRVVCAEDAELLMLKSEDVLLIFDRDELNLLKRSVQSSILEELIGLKQRVVEEENSKKKITDTTVKTLLGLKGNLKDKSIFRPKAHSLQPLAKKIQNNFKSFMQQNTVKTLTARQVFRENPYCS